MADGRAVGGGERISLRKSATTSCKSNCGVIADAAVGGDVCCEEEPSLAESRAAHTPSPPMPPPREEQGGDADCSNTAGVAAVGGDVNGDEESPPAERRDGEVESRPARSELTSAQPKHPVNREKIPGDQNKIDLTCFIEIHIYTLVG